MEENDIFEKIHSFKRFGSVLGLDRIKHLLLLLGNPQNDLKVIHVAGTNGKGSVCNFTYSILQEQGYKVGLYISPYIENFTERIQYNGREITKDQLGKYSKKVFDKIELMITEGYDSPTEFEVITAIAILYYKEMKADFVILEVGLGGRGDGTNVVDNPIVSVITPIALDHTEYLGNTISEIAFEKAGIIKDNSIVIANVRAPEAYSVVENICKEKKCNLIRVNSDGIFIKKTSLEGSTFDYKIGNTCFDNIEIKMIGDHQIENASTALTIVEALENEGYRISRDAIYKGLEKTKYIGRFEIMQKNPYIIIDGAHNIQGITSLKNTIESNLPNKKILLCIGMLKDKNVSEMLDEILQISNDNIALEPPIEERKMRADDLCDLINKKSHTCKSMADIDEAIRYVDSIKNNYDVVVFTGSLYLLGKIRSFFK